MKKLNNAWGLWIVVAVSLVIYLSYIFITDQKEIFSPGEITHGHHQIEMSCSSCHADSFGGGPVIQNACVDCHKEDLKESDDSHPKSKFTDPRNISRVKELDARICVTCHTEHRPEITNAMGVTIPEDFCFKCHQDIAEDRSSHVGMKFTDCASSGCHNYHDNRSLYEDFLEKHIGEPTHLTTAEVIKKSSPAEISTLSNYPLEKYPLNKLLAKELDAPKNTFQNDLIVDDWSKTSHAQAGVNCTACHEQKQSTGGIIWKDKPGQESCKNCHSTEVKGFLSGKHGMRLAEGLTPMLPDMSKLAMKQDAHSKELSCMSCHSSHKFDIKYAAVDACLGCHNDKHSREYKKSPHFVTWDKELSGLNSENTGVSCSTCHMPRKEFDVDEKTLVLSEHNQNMNLRPNDKMLRTVCMNCHGLGFSMDALADKDLVNNNFNGLPKVHVQSIDLVNERLLKRNKPKEGSP